MGEFEVAKAREKNVALALLAAMMVVQRPAWSEEIAPLPRITSEPLRTPVIANGNEFWTLGKMRESHIRNDAADAAPTLCALTLRAQTNATDPAFESLEVGLERDPTASTKERIVGTMYLRVRFADATTWHAMTPHAIKVWLDKVTSTEGWRVESPNREGYVRISKPTLDSDEHERAIFGLAAGDTLVDVAIKTKPEGGWILYRVTINRVGFPTPAADAMRTCLQAMGSEALTEGAYEAEIRDHRPPK
ncbi:MAG: hypothetical protein IBJ15_05855 [Alphaproteobacteria bacterium]|nr:hypothetical protein [Alphaproteobacteria bacterium]